MVRPQVKLEPKQLGFGWWAFQCVGLVVVLGLMGVLAFALMMLTRMPVEGTTQPDVHLPTLIVWFVLCSVLIVGSMLRGTWRELADERVHVDLGGNELRIDRWSPTHERERYAERVAADERARGRERREEADEPGPIEPVAVTSEELRAAALRRREVGPGVPASVRAGRWSGPLRLLRAVALVCLYAWLPLSLVLVIVFVELQDRIASEWGLLPMLLLPIGWVLMEGHQVMRHRWLRTKESRSDLALWQGMTAFVGVVLLAVVAFTGVVMREEYLGVALISFPLMVLCVWIVRLELKHYIPSGSGGEGGGGSNLDVDLSWID